MKYKKGRSIGDGGGIGNGSKVYEAQGDPEQLPNSLFAVKIMSGIIAEGVVQILDEVTILSALKEVSHKSRTVVHPF